MADIGLDIRHGNDYVGKISLIEGRFLGASYKAERDAAPARGFAIRTRAASGIIHAGTTAGAGFA